MYSKKSKVLSRIIAILMIISITSMGFPATVFASDKVFSALNDQTLTDENTTDVTTSNNTDTTPGTTPAKDKKILGELVEKREANIKHFLMDDMTEEAVVYPGPVHYKENGQWKEIDNSLVSANDDTVGDGISNKANEFKINIAKDTTSNKLVKIKKGNYEVSWNIKDVQNSTAQVINEDSNEVLKLSDEDKKKFVKNIESNVVFPDIYQDTDLSYTIDSNNLKENIVLKKATNVETFKFDLTAKNVVAQLMKDNTIVFNNIKDKSEVFRIEAPVMYDANGDSTKDINLELTADKDNYSLTMTPSQKWLNDSNRVYPITIDPTISTSDVTQVTSAIVRQCPTDSTYDNTTYDGLYLNYLEVGNGSVGTGRNVVEKTYVKFNLPTLEAGDMVTSATLGLYLYTCPTDKAQINAYGVKDNWNVSGNSPITFNNQPSHNSTAEDYANYVAPVSWNITGLTKDWYINGNNNGVLLESTTDTTAGSGITKLYSTGYSSTSKKPVITIQYRNNSGLEKYWSYHSQSVGRAGTIFTNDYNGNVVAVHDDVSLSGNRIPINLRHVYNTNSKNDDIGYGSGWRLNYNQTIVKKSTDTGATYFDYTDEDGTIHNFTTGTIQYLPGQYKDNSGLYLELAVNSDNTYTITDKKYNTWNFTTDGKLSTMKDSNQNALTIEYNTEGRINKISDKKDDVTPYRTISLSYDQGGHLQSITDADNRTTSYGYTENQLTSITYPDDGNTSRYTYNNNTDNVLLSVQNYDNYKATIDYYVTNLTSGIVYKAKKMQEYGNDGTYGKSYTISYGSNSSSFIDANGKTQKYQFNDLGNTTNIQNDDGSAQFYGYNANVSSYPNRLVTQSKLQSSIINMISDPSFERGTGTEWIHGTKGNASQESATTSSFSHYGHYCMLLTNNDGGLGPYYDQSISLTPGNSYNFSGYIKTNNVSNQTSKGASLNVLYYNASNSLQSLATSDYVTGTNDWQRYNVSFTLPKDAASNTVILEAQLCGETGTAYFDDFQLEAGDVCNRYNWIENGDFSSFDSTTNSPKYWYEDYCTTSDIVTTDTGTHPAQLDNNVFKITGDTKKAKAIRRTISTNTHAGDVYVFGGWAKADAAPNHNNTDLFDIELSFGTTTHRLNFNPGCKDWQYVTDQVLATDATSITITINYPDNVNSAMFDGIQLFKEDYGNTYNYDSYGNMSSVVDIANQNHYLSYSNNYNLTSYVDPNGNDFSYTHDSNHNVITARSGAGVKQTFGHDPYGNITSITGGSSTSAAINTQVTYSQSGNYLASIKDTFGNTVYKNYDEKTGNLDSVKDANGTSINYQYDILGRLLNTMSTNNNASYNAGYTYENDQLKTISTNGVTYNFGYDSLGRNNNVSVGNQTLITNNYDNSNDNLLGSTYGNGQTAGQDYDNLNRIIDQKYNEIALFNYEYDDSGNLASIKDSVNGVTYNYTHDFANRLVLVSEKDSSGKSTGNSTSYTYDNDNNVTKIIDTEGRNSSKSAYTTSYSYDGDNRITSITTPTGVAISTAYDILGLGRVTSKKINSNYTTTYNYAAGFEANATSKEIASITNGTKTLSYTYDVNGNIHTINDGTNTITYTYNELNELTREDNPVLNETISYTYDGGGNILAKKQYSYTTIVDLETVSPTSTINYGYSETWKDELTSYNGNGITNDAIGNPVSYNGYNYTWERGRELASLSGNGLNESYMYNSNGIRTQKTVNGVATTYHLVGNNVTFEDNGTDSIYYTYDPNGILVSMNLNGTEYFYVRNAQGDIIQLVDKNGATVASYVYDTWGKLVSIKDGSGNDVTNATTSVGYKNPYRYRGYRYDTETGLYYCNSRYYNPEWGRFINADSQTGKVGQMLSHNLFAYCLNNPVNCTDPSGNYTEYNYYDDYCTKNYYDDETSELLYSEVYNYSNDHDTPTLGVLGTALIADDASGAGVLDDFLLPVLGIIYLAKQSGKEKANDVPSWAKGNSPYEGENGNDFAKRLCDNKYGPGNYRTGPGSEYNKLRKWGDRGFN